MIGNVRPESQRPVDEGVVILSNDAWSAVIGRVEFLSGLLYREVLYYTLAQVGGKSQKSGPPTAEDRHRFHVARSASKRQVYTGDLAASPWRFCPPTSKDRQHGRACPVGDHFMFAV